MSRLLLLFIFALCMVPVGGSYPPQMGSGRALAIFLGGYCLLVGVIRGWAVSLSRQVDGTSLHRSLGRFNRLLAGARGAIPAWLAFAIFGGLGWRRMVIDLWAAVGVPTETYTIAWDGQLRTLDLVYQLPGLLLAAAPALAAWAGLWWAHYPADRALREQSLLSQLDQNLPVHTPPTLRQYMGANLRQQLLFTLLPVGLIVLLRDLVVLAYHTLAHRPAPAGLGDMVVLPAAALVLLFSPELLRRVLHTRPLPDSPLRRRLEAICRRSGLRYREILLWHTQYSVGNAAVMGLLPGLRYIMLSDLLLETMDDQQIEAVFAHELGHIVHRHMLWYVVFFVGLSLLAMGPTDWLDRLANDHPRIRWVFELGSLGGMFGAVIVAFGFVSRRFERQADVFAARMIQSDWNQNGSPPAGLKLDGSYVGERGAGVFASALARVALVNNIPVAGRSWCHGSIAKRMRYLHGLSADPGLTERFDRLMSRVYMLLVAALLLGGSWVAAQEWLALKAVANVSGRAQALPGPAIAVDAPRR